MIVLKKISGEVMVRVLSAFVAGVLVTYVTAVMFYTQINLGNLVEMGLTVDFSTRVQAAWHDLLGMTTLYLPIITVALLLGFAIARGVLTWVPQLRTLGYISAGFVAIFAIDFALGLAFQTHPIAVTRTPVGLISQCVAGAIGGYVFSRFSSATKIPSYKI